MPVRRYLIQICRLPYPVDLDHAVSRGQFLEPNESLSLPPQQIVAGVADHQSKIVSFGKSDALRNMASLGGINSKDRLIPQCTILGGLLASGEV